MNPDVSIADALFRVFGPASANISVTLTPDTVDAYTVSGQGEQIHIIATSPATALHAVRKALSADGLCWDEVGGIRPTRQLRAPRAPLQATARFQHRYYGNESDNAYTGAYRDFASWERHIDDLAGRGVNEVLVPVGTDAVFADFLTAHGYSEAEARAWVPLPTHLPWLLLQNMSGWPEGPSMALIERQANLGARIVERLTSLGMRAVLPGFSGIVPRDFGERNDVRVHVPTKIWQGFRRPGWLDPSDPAFSEMAASFYEASEARLGVSSMMKIDVLHEGGTSGSIDLTAAGRAIQSSLEAARPGSTWVTFGWQRNPPKDLLRGVDTSRMLIVDGLSDRYQNMDRHADFLAAPYAFGAVWSFGGDTTLGAQAATWATRLDEWADAPDSALCGIAAMPEGGFSNSFALDFFHQFGWNRADRSVGAWAEEWATARYGKAVPGASQAWRRIAETAYSLPDDNNFSEAHDSLFHAWPNFDVRASTNFSPTEVTYDLESFAEALRFLLAASDALRDEPAYRFDIADIARQCLANTSRLLLPAIRAAYTASDVERYDLLTDLWSQALRLLDDVTGTNALWLLGRVLDEARAAASTDAEADALERSQRILITTWGPEYASTSGLLSNYAGREYQGLLGEVYLKRWSRFFAEMRPSNDRTLRFTLGSWWHYNQDWVNATDRTGIRSVPTGDPIELAKQAQELLRRVADAIPASS